MTLKNENTLQDNMDVSRPAVHILASVGFDRV